MNDRSIAAIQAEIEEEFSMFDDWTAKYEYLIDLGRSLPLIDPALKDDDHLIRGCQSRVWMASALEGENMRYTADSDAIITKGIIGLLIRVLDNHPPEEVYAADLTFIDAIGLREHLSPTRANGLLSMVKQMKYDALAHTAKKSS
ncbi:SufE family protein [bacterium]|nr:SufE family protein [bacterium]